MQQLTNIFIPGPIKELPTGDRLVLHANGEKILETVNGDKVYFSLGVSQLDSDNDIEILNIGPAVIYRYPNNDCIETIGQNLLSLKRGVFKIECDKNDDSTFIVWINN